MKLHTQNFIFSWYKHLYPLGAKPAIFQVYPQIDALKFVWNKENRNPRHSRGKKGCKCLAKFILIKT